MGTSEKTVERVVLGPLVSQWEPLKRPWRGCFAQRAFNLDFLTWKIILATQGENMESISMSCVLDSWVHHQNESVVMEIFWDITRSFWSFCIFNSLTWMKAAPVLPSKHAGEGTSKAWHPQHHICQVKWFDSIVHVLELLWSWLKQ